MYDKRKYCVDARGISEKSKERKPSRPSIPPGPGQCTHISIDHLVAERARWEGGRAIVVWMPFAGSKCPVYRMQMVYRRK